MLLAIASVDPHMGACGRVEPMPDLFPEVIAGEWHRTSLRDLPAGRYVVEAVDNEAPALSPDEEAGVEAALESYRQGRVVDAKRARQIIDTALGR